MQATLTPATAHRVVLRRHIVTLVADMVVAALLTGSVVASRNPPGCGMGCQAFE